MCMLMLQVLLHGTPLLSSTGEEYQSYETDPEFQKMSAQVSRPERAATPPSTPPFSPPPCSTRRGWLSSGSS